MEITSYILKEFKPFSLDTKVSEVKSFFCETSYSHFPIVDNKHIIGLISENDIQEVEDNLIEVAAINPIESMQAVINKDLIEIAQDVSKKLENVIKSL